MKIHIGKELHKYKDYEKSINRVYDLVNIREPKGETQV